MQHDHEGRLSFDRQRARGFHGAATAALALDRDVPPAALEEMQPDAGAEAVPEGSRACRMVAEG